MMLNHEEFDSVHTRAGDDQIGLISITPVDWQYRRSVKAIIEELKRKPTSTLALKSNISSQTLARRLKMTWWLGSSSPEQLQSGCKNRKLGGW